MRRSNKWSLILGGLVAVIFTVMCLLDGGELGTCAKHLLTDAGLAGIGAGAAAAGGVAHGVWKVFRR